MPRSLVLGNGELFLGIDDVGVVREFTWPQVGYPNHLVDGWIKWGVFVEGQFSWLSSADWYREFEAISMRVGARSRFISEGLALEILVEDWLEDGGRWRREMTVLNRLDREREVRIFQSQLFNIDESELGNTAFYEPQIEGVVHYKNGRWISVRGEGYSRVEWSCGFADWQEYEGTWRDAEDGWLTGKPIEQGKVDSTLGWAQNVEPGQAWKLQIAVSAFGDECGVLVPMEWSADRQRCYDARFTDEVDLGFGLEIDEIIGMSQRYVRAHLDRSGGVIAAGDSEILKTARASYACVWFRDGALVADAIGHEAFWSFFLQCVGDGNWAHQKYSVQGDIASGWLPRIYHGKSVLPIQQDECALPIWFALKHGLNEGRETVIRFLDHMLEFRDSDGLPLPSWDLWEERYGVHLWTAVTVISALNRGGESDLPRAKEYDAAAKRMVDAVKAKFWSHKYDCLARGLVPDENGDLHQDVTPDASQLLAILFDESGSFLDWLPGMVERVRNELWVDSEIGGVARYPGDYYFRIDDRFPGNPWVICSLWLARAEMKLSQSRAELDEIFKQAMTWCALRSSSTYVLAEQFHPVTGEQLSVAPLTWSHAEVVETYEYWKMRRSEL